MHISRKMAKGGMRLFSAMMAIVLAIGLMPLPAFADNGGGGSSTDLVAGGALNLGTRDGGNLSDSDPIPAGIPTQDEEGQDVVYISISDDGKFVESDGEQAGVTMANVAIPISEVAKIKLEDFGLSEYAYAPDGVDQVTVLHLYLYVLSHYYSGGTGDLEITGGPGSLYLKNGFWGFDENLTYDANCEYPLSEEGQGATADQIALRPGLHVDLAHFTDWNFRFDESVGHCYFYDASKELKRESITLSFEAVANEPITLGLLRGKSDMNTGSDTAYYEVVNQDVYYDTAYDAEGGVTLGTTDAYGKVTATFTEPGTYYVWADGLTGDSGTYVSGPAMAKVTVAPAPEPATAKINLLAQVEKNTLAKVLFGFEVSSDEAAKYGYEKPEGFEGVVTLADAAAALHHEIYGEDFDANPTDYLKISSAGTCTLIFGEATYMNGFRVNDATPEYPDQPGTGSLWNDTPIASGDNVRIFKVNGDMYGIYESYLMFDKAAYTAHEGGSVDVTVTGDLTFGTMMGMPADVQPVEDATVYAVTDFTDPEGTMVAEAVTDKDGVAAFEDLPAGDYHLVVSAYENDYEEDCFSTPYATLSVSAHQWAGDVTLPTFEAAGSIAYSCSVEGCEATKTEAIPAYGFTVTVDGEAVAADAIKVEDGAYDASYEAGHYDENWDWVSDGKVESHIPLVTVAVPEGTEAVGITLNDSFPEYQNYIYTAEPDESGYTQYVDYGFGDKVSDYTYIAYANKAYEDVALPAEGNVIRVQSAYDANYVSYNLYAIAFVEAEEDDTVPAELQLSTLEFRAGSTATSTLRVLDPVFDPAVKTYTVVAPTNLGTIGYVFATLSDTAPESAKIEAVYPHGTSGVEQVKTISSGGSGVSLASSLASNSFSGNTITIKVNGEEAYVVNVVRQAPLNSLVVKNGDETIALTPTFAQATYEYTANMSADAQLSVTPTINNTALGDAATFNVAGQVVENKGTAQVTPMWSDRSYDLVVTVSGEGAVDTVYTIHCAEQPATLVVETPPTKTAYDPGESFDPAGMTLKATFADGGEKIVSSEEFTYSPTEALKLADSTITVTYAGMTVDQAITINSPFEGSGTVEDPFLIKTAADYDTIKGIVDSGDALEGAYFKQTADITLSDGWTPIGSTTAKCFSGNLDGDNHTVTVPADCRPLFGFVKFASVSNLNIFGERIAGAGLVDNMQITGVNDPALTLENITLKSGSNTLRSGLVDCVPPVNAYGAVSAGFMTTIRNCTVEEGVTVGYGGDLDYVGGFAGRFQGMIENSTCNATVKGANYVGGFVGMRANSLGTPVGVKNSTFGGTVVATGEYVGGIAGAGYVHATAPNCGSHDLIGNTVTGSVTGANKVGGILGGNAVAQTWNNTQYEFKDNSFTGTVTATAENADAIGGIAGYYRSLNMYDVITNNFYSSTCGAEKGIGKVDYVDTNCTTHETESGALYFSTENDTSGCPTVSGCSWKKGHNRTDDPLGADAGNLCKTDAEYVSAKEAADQKAAAAADALAEAGTAAQNAENALAAVETATDPVAKVEAAQAAVEAAENAVSKAQAAVTAANEAAEAAQAASELALTDEQKAAASELVTEAEAASAQAAQAKSDADAAKQGAEAAKAAAEAAQAEAYNEAKSTAEQKAAAAENALKEANAAAEEAKKAADAAASITDPVAKAAAAQAAATAAQVAAEKAQAAVAAANEAAEAAKALEDLAVTDEQKEAATEVAAAAEAAQGQAAKAKTEADSAKKSADDAKKAADEAKKKAEDAAKVEVGKSYTVSGMDYKVTALAGSANGTVTLVKAKDAKKVAVPATVKLADGKTYSVTVIGSKAFNGLSKLTTVTVGKNVKKIQRSAFFKTKNLKKLVVKSKLLKKKASVKAAFKGSKAKKLTVKVPKKLKKAYKKSFAKANIKAPKKVTVK